MRLCVPWHQQRRACPSHVHSHITWRPAWSLAIGTQTLSYPSASLSSPCPASTTAPGVQHSSVLAVFASIAANDILLAKVQNLPVHSCRSQAEPSREWARRWTPTVHFPTSHCPQSSLACHKNNAWLPLSKQAGVAASGFACFGHLQLLPPWLDVVAVRFWAVPGCDAVIRLLVA